MPIETKTKNLNWPSLQGTVLGGGAYILERFASADENTATFETRTGGERTSKALVRLVQADEETSEQQLQVWQAIKRSGHPNLIPIWGTGRARISGHSLIYVVMEACDENLGNALDERALEPAEAGEILFSLVGALGHLHSHGFVHGCLSPEQVMAVGETVKVSTGGVRRIGSLEGLDFHKAKYRAPESPEGNISPAADVWCLGATLLQALTQRACGENCLEQAAGLSRPFDAIVTSCLQPEPVARGTLSQLLAMYEGTATTNGAAASAAGASAPKTMAAAAGSGRGAISFDWDGDEAPEPKRETAVAPVYLAPGPIVPEADAFAAEAVAAAAVGDAAVADAAVAPVVTKEAVEEPVGAPAAERSAAEARVEELPPNAVAPSVEEADLESEAKEPVAEEAGPVVTAAPIYSEERVDEEAALPSGEQRAVERGETEQFEFKAAETKAAETKAAETVAPYEDAHDVAEAQVEERPFERMDPLLARTRVQPQEERFSRDADEADPVAAANARLLAWREAAAAATRSQDEPNQTRQVPAGTDAIKRAKRRAWVFVAVALLILVAVVWALRPSGSATNRGAQRVAQNTALPAGSSANPKHEQPLHGQTMTLPAAGQSGPASAPATAAAPKSAPAATTAKEDAAQSVGPVGRGPVWRVILYTYNREADAKRRAATVNRRHPDLAAEVFAPNGAGKSPFLVSIGGSTDRNAMTELRRNAVSLGLPRDSYLQNYSR